MSEGSCVEGSFMWTHLHAQCVRRKHLAAAQHDEIRRRRLVHVLHERLQGESQAHGVSGQGRVGKGGRIREGVRLGKRALNPIPVASVLLVRRSQLRTRSVAVRRAIVLIPAARSRISNAASSAAAAAAAAAGRAIHTLSTSSSTTTNGRVQPPAISRQADSRFAA